MIGSCVGERAMTPGSVPYSATKGAVKMFTQEHPTGRARVKIEKKLLLGGCIPAKCSRLRTAPQATAFSITRHQRPRTRTTTRTRTIRQAEEATRKAIQ